MSHVKHAKALSMCDKCRKMARIERRIGSANILCSDCVYEELIKLKNKNDVLRDKNEQLEPEKIKNISYNLYDILGFLRDIATVQKVFRQLANIYNFIFG